MLSKKYDLEIKRLRNDLEVMTRKNESSKEYKIKYEENEKIFSGNEKLMKDFELKFRAAEQEKNEIKQESGALLKKLKNDALYKENLVYFDIISLI